MPYLDSIMPSLAILATLGIVAGGVGYLISQFRSGSRKATTDSREIIEFYKLENQTLKEIASSKDKSNDAKFLELSKELAELKGQLKSEKEQNDRLEKIFQNRDPEIDNFRKVLLEASVEQAKINKEVLRILKEIYSMAIAEHNKDYQVTSTITK